MSTELILIRHGETEWNAVGRIQGHRAVDLNKRGHQQAQAVAQRLKTEAFDALYTSDLSRATQTAEAIQTNHPIQTDSRLREWNLGVLAGLTPQQAETQYPKAYAIYRDGRVDDPIPQGESIRDRYTRVTTCLAEIAFHHPDQRIVVVTHGGPLGDCYRRATNMSLDTPRDFQLYNASINTFTLSGSTWTLNTWGNITHLESIGSLGDWEGRK
jgi:probable phosphoglycerate mutase